MTINPSTVGHDSYDLLDGSLSSFYQDVDEAIVASEVVKGQYRLTVSPAYNSPNPVTMNNFTTLALSQSGPMVVDLENSYITTQAVVKFRFNTPIAASTEAGNACFFIGWKSSVEAIERYDILVNSTPIYNQAFCGEESYLQYQTLNENVKHTSPYIYSSYDEVINMSPNVCGTYFIVNTSSKIETTMEQVAYIPIKIPITNFMILKNLKYLLSWMGKWELRIYLNYNNMVIMPINNETLKATLPNMNGHPGMAKANIAKHQQFTQIGQNFMFPNGTKDAASATQNITVFEMTFNDVEMVSAQFQLRMDICEMLKQKYLGGKPLTFPVSTFQIARFTGPVGAGHKIARDSYESLNSVLCQAINNCDTMYILPFMSTLQKTVCRNPHVANFQLHAGEYGTYPTQPFDSWQAGDRQSTRHIRYLNIIADSLNVNSSNLTSFNTDVLGAHFYQLPVSGSNLSQKNIDQQYIGPNGKTFDQSNFFFAIPFSTDDDFQGGLSSPASNINFKLTGQLYNLTGGEIEYNTPWVAAFLIDGVIMIRPDPGSDAAKVIWSDRTVV